LITTMMGEVDGSPALFWYVGAGQGGGVGCGVGAGVVLAPTTAGDGCGVEVLAEDLREIGRASCRERV